MNGDKRKAAEIILNNELQLTQELQFHLIIHQPFRPVEGLLIDIKVTNEYISIYYLNMWVLKIL